MTDDDGTPVIRKCRLCGRREFVQADCGDSINLFQYGVRHYAHAICLATRFGTKPALEMIPEYEWKEFRFALKYASQWDKALISVKNAQVRRLAQKEARR